jgi:preprotein translocase subunit SecG
MEVIIEILTVIVCILLVMVVLVQDSKGGGLSSAFGGSNQIMGVRQTTDFLEKATWVLAISLLALSLLSAYFMQTSSTTTSNGIESVSKQRADAAPAMQQRQAPQAPQGQQQAAPQQQQPAQGGKQ